MVSKPALGSMILSLLMIFLIIGCDRADEQSSVPAPPGDVQSDPSSEPMKKPSVTFTELSAEVGLELTITNGAEHGHHSILQTLGSGVAVCDYDLDGREDLLFSRGGTYSPEPQPTGMGLACFRQLAAWEFAETTRACGLQKPLFYSHGLFAADYNNDGFTDFLLTGYGNVALYENNGDGTFTEATATSQIVNNQWSTAAAWADFNHDGHLDLYIVNYVNWSFANNPVCIRGGQADVCPPAQFEPLDDQLWLSRGDGTFECQTSQTPLTPGGKGLGVLAADFDTDGDIDLYVANDTVANFLFLNDGTGRLEEEGFASGTAVDREGVANGSMGIDTADLNGDGLPEIWVANYEDEQFALYENLGHGLFEHKTRRWGIAAVESVFVGFGTRFLDFDLDGDQDLVVTNGHVMEQMVNSSINQMPLLLENQGNSFANIAEQAGSYFSTPHLGRGLATSDLDQDGDSDLVITHTNSPSVLLRNERENQNQWIQLELVGTESNRNAIGSRIRIETPSGVTFHQITSGASYLSTSSRTLVVGLDGEPCQSIQITFPKGKTIELEMPQVNRKYQVTESGEIFVQGPSAQSKK